MILPLFALKSSIFMCVQRRVFRRDLLTYLPVFPTLDKKLARVKTAPVEREEALAEDAAGFRK